MKLLIVGMDAADYEMTKRFLPRLPTLKTFSCFGKLISTDFPSSPAAWCSAYTGCTPDEHGIGGFRRDGAKPIRVPFFWDDLRCKIGLVNLLCINGEMVKDDFDGFVIPGFSAPVKYYPPRIRLNKWIVDTTQHQRGRLRWLLRGPDRLTKGVKEAQIEFLRFNRQVEKRHVNEAIRLAKLFNVDVLFITIMMLDRVGHGFIQHEATMFDCFKTIDNHVGRMIEELRPETVVAFSDHGMDVSDSPRIPETVHEYKRKALQKNPHKLKEKGLHTLEGVFFAKGLDIRECQPEGTIWDVAPTVLRILGVPKPDYMTGIAMDIFTELSDDEEIELLKSLRALGYV